MVICVTHSILMDFPIQINPTRMGSSIVYFKGSLVKISKYLWHSLLEFFLIILANSAGSDEMPHFVAFHLGLNFMPKYSFRGFKKTKGYRLISAIHSSSLIYVQVSNWYSNVERTV